MLICKAAKSILSDKDSLILRTGIVKLKEICDFTQIDVDEMIESIADSISNEQNLLSECGITSDAVIDFYVQKMKNE